MKNKTLLFLFLLQNLTSTAQIYLSGTVKNYKKDFIEIATISNYQLVAAMDTLSLQEGTFNIILESNTLVEIIIDFPEDDYKLKGYRFSIFASPGDQIHFDIDLSTIIEGEDVPVCQFNGSNAKGHQLFYIYQSHPFIDYYDWYEKILQNGKDVKSTYRQFLAEMDDLIDPYRKLLQQDQIDSSYFTLIEEDIKVGQMNGFVSYIEDKMNNPSFQFLGKEALKKLSLKMLNNCPSFDEVGLLAGGQFTSLMLNLLAKQRLARNVENSSDYPDTVVFVKGRSYSLDHFMSAGFSLKEQPLQEFFWAFQLNFLIQTMIGIPEYYDEGLAFFKAYYPNSQYLPDLEWQLKRNDQRFAAISTPPEPIPPPVTFYAPWGPVILDDAWEMEGFKFKKDTIDLSQGIYYVDIWATWCRPCLVAMEHNFQADSLLDANGIERLYISIDKLENYTKWITILEEFHLGGYHVLAGDHLKLLLSDEIGGGGGSIFIPRYLFIKDGEMVIKKAAGPGKLKKLEEQVRKLKRM